MSKKIITIQLTYDNQDNIPNEESIDMVEEALFDSTIENVAIIDMREFIGYGIDTEVYPNCNFGIENDEFI